MNSALCPSCKRPRVAEFAPFCSQRCKDVDLGRWFSGSYVAAGKDGDAFLSEEGEALLSALLGDDEDNEKNM